MRIHVRIWRESVRTWRESGANLCESGADFQAAFIWIWVVAQHDSPPTSTFNLHRLRCLSQARVCHVAPRWQRAAVYVRVACSNKQHQDEIFSCSCCFQRQKAPPFFVVLHYMDCTKHRTPCDCVEEGYESKDSSQQCASTHDEGGPSRREWTRLACEPPSSPGLCPRASQGCLQES